MVMIKKTKKVKGINKCISYKVFRLNQHMDALLLNKRIRADRRAILIGIIGIIGIIGKLMTVINLQ